MLKVAEVYEKQIKELKERADGSEYANFTKIYETRECLINPKYIVAITAHEFTSPADLKKLEGQIPEGSKFSKLVVDGNSFRSSEIIVVGSFEYFCQVLEQT